MEEIKKYLEEKRKKLFHKKLVLAGSLAIRSIIKSAKTKLVTEWEKELEVVNQEYDKVEELLKVLEEKAPEAQPTTNINDVYKHLSNLLIDEIDRRVESLDVQENEMFARLRVSELEFAYSQLKGSHWMYDPYHIYRS